MSAIEQVAATPQTARTGDSVSRFLRFFKVANSGSMTYLTRQIRRCTSAPPSRTSHAANVIVGWEGLIVTVLHAPCNPIATLAC